MKPIIGAVLLALSTNVWAAECPHADTQLEINQCSGETFNQADQQLNDTWQSILKRFNHDPSKIRQLRVAQRAWLTFRDAEVEALFPCDDDNKRRCWGSMYPTLYAEAMTRLTEERNRSLQEHLRSRESGVVETSGHHLVTTRPSFMGMSRGDKLSLHTDQLRKTTIENGEGRFDVFAIYEGNNRLGHVDVYTDDSNEQVIGSIFITSPLAVTETGIKIGSTWGELKKALPDIDVHGSEIGSHTYADFGHLSFKLQDVYFGVYDVPASEVRKIKDSTKITEIWLR